MPEVIKRTSRDRRAHKSKVVTGQKPRPEKRPPADARIEDLENEVAELKARIEALENA